MSLSSVLFLFLTHLGVGIAVSLAVIRREAGVKFFRFNAGLAAVLIAIAFAFRPEGPESHATLHAAALGLLGACEALLLIYWATIGRMLAAWRRPLLLGAIAAGTGALVAQAVDLSAGQGALARALTVASFLTSAGLLGGACVALILGHWYLVLPTMDVALLQSMVKYHIGSLVLRIVVVIAAVVVAIEVWEPGAVPSFGRYISTSSGIFFWQRVLFGLAGPVLLSWLTWETAKIRSTQSATGILYVDFFTVVVGEVLAKYLVLSTRVPL